MLKKDKVLLRHRIAAIFIAICLLCFISVLFYISSQYAKVKNTPVAEKGVMDCTDKLVDVKNGLYLQGEWEFYWQQFIITDGKKTDPAYEKVPSSWTKYKDSDGNFYPSSGYASYRMIVKNYDSRAIMTAVIDNYSCPYRIFVNGELVVTNGVVSKNESDMFSYAAIILGENLSFYFDESDIEIVVEVASINDGGLTHLPKLITYYPYVNDTINDVIIVWVYLGIIASIAGVTIIKFIIEGKRQITLSLIIVVVLVIIKIILSPQIFAIYQHRTGFISAEQINLVKYIINYLLLVSFIYFIHQFIAKEKKKIKYPWAITAYAAIILCLIISYIFNVIPQTMELFHVLSIIPIIYYLIYTTITYFKLNIKYGDYYLYSLYFGCLALLINFATDRGYLRFKLINLYYIILISVLVIIIIVSSLRNRANMIELEKTRALEKKLSEAQNAIMFSQMKPHFIYNALNSIKYLVITHSDEAEEAIDIFSSYLRTNMNLLEINENIPFEKELEHIKNYTTIEKIRFCDILKVIYDIKEKNFMVPPLSIQPLVENAIKHGITNKVGGGMVTIRTTSDSEFYYIYIIDNGLGFDASSKNKKSDEEINSNGKKQYHSYGLRNTKERLAYMVNGTLTIDSIIGEGTTITVKIPKK